jgi:8-oxo-dGTP diphosphatase
MGPQQPPMARPAVAAGALFTDYAGRILLVRPTYKPQWEIPGGCVEPGESPLAACVREIQEELGITPPIGAHLVVDWAPKEAGDDRLLFIFDGGQLGAQDQERILLGDGELSEWRFVPADELDEYLPARLSRRVRTAICAQQRGRPLYAEHGEERR